MFHMLRHVGLLELFINKITEISQKYNAGNMPSMLNVGRKTIGTNEIHNNQ